MALFTVAWIGLEGDLRPVMALAAGLTLVIGGHFARRFLIGRSFAIRYWLMIAGGGGSLMALLFWSLTLLLMALKTGLHNHGPEFSAKEFDWVIGQLLHWIGAGLLAGLGIGLILLAKLSYRTTGSR